MIPIDPGHVAVRLGVAALGGLAVGVEREWSARARSRPPRFAGVRTFLLLGLLAGLAGELYRAGLPAAGTALLAAAGALAVAAYVLAAIRGDIDGTTEVSALVVLAGGFVAGMGQLALASGLFALTALVLVEKSRIHAFVHRLEPRALEGAARFAVLALVVLPLLPAGPFGPAPGVRPREVWTLVLLFSGVSFAGFLALRLAGPERGYALAGLMGGLVSSTAVTLSFARESRLQPEQGRALGLGVVTACAVLPARTGILAAALNPALGAAAVPYLAPPLAAGLATAALVMRGGETATVEARTPDNPLRLASAIQMAAAFLAVLYVMEWVGRRFGASGILVSSALLGLTDVDALTYSMVKLGGDLASAGTAGQALGVGLLANTVLKLALAVGIGQGRFRRIAGTGLAILAGATGAGLWLA
jgi:uncharacterized membrane protein (DUF4010 family)